MQAGLFTRNVSQADLLDLSVVATVSWIPLRGSTCAKRTPGGQQAPIKPPAFLRVQAYLKNLIELTLIKLGVKLIYIKNRMYKTLDVSWNWTELIYRLSLDGVPIGVS